MTLNIEAVPVVLAQSWIALSGKIAVSQADTLGTEHKSGSSGSPHGFEGAGR